MNAIRQSTLSILIVVILMLGVIMIAQPVSATVSIPTGATIESATLSLYVTHVSSEIVNVHRVTSPWEENTVTWNSFGADYDPSVVASFVPSSLGWVSADITGLVQAWVNGTHTNLGVLLEQWKTLFTQYRSSEYSEVVLRPKLEICYSTPAGGSTCVTIQRPGNEQDGVADAYIWEKSPDSNNGSSPKIFTGLFEEIEKQLLMRFFFEATPVASLGDFVWEDADADGVQETGEAGISGVKVNLYECDGTFLQSTTTVDGYYMFTGLAAGEFKVEFLPPAGYLNSPMNVGDDTTDSDADGDGMTGCVSLAAGVTNLTIDTGLYRTAKIGDFVWEDLDQDGVQEAGETGLGGVRVELLDCSGMLIQSTTTDSSGYYGFIVQPGKYSVKFTLPEGYAFSPSNQGYDNLDSDADIATGMTSCTDLTSGEEDLTWDAGLYKLPEPKASIGDFVWYDMNANGIQDVGELGVEGVSVSLYRCDGAPAGTTTTDGSGFYLFSDLMPGDYYVAFANSNGYVFTLLDQGGDDELDSDADPTMGRTVCTTLTSGENDMTWDAGLYRPQYTNPGTGTPGYWKNHPEAWPVEEITIGGVTYTKEQALGWLEQNDKHDKTITLFRALVAAKLNVLIGNDSSCVAATITGADAWMEANGPVGRGVRANSEAWKQGEPLYLSLDAYNNGLSCAPGRD